MHKLVFDSDPNDSTNLEAKTFSEATEESLLALDWYVIDEGDRFVGINNADSSDEIVLTEQTYEDAQYELITKLGYYIAIVD